MDAIVISHLHADHCIDLTAYIVALRYGCDARYKLAGPEGRIPLVGPAGTRDRLEAAYDPLARKLALQELFGFSKPADMQLGPFALSFAAGCATSTLLAKRSRKGEPTYLEMMSDRYDLTPSQVDRMRSLLEDERKDVDAILAKVEGQVKDDVAAARKKTQERIRDEVLDEQQRAAFVRDGSGD